MNMLLVRSYYKEQVKSTYSCFRQPSSSISWNDICLPKWITDNEDFVYFLYTIQDYSYGIGM